MSEKGNNSEAPPSGFGARLVGKANSLKEQATSVADGVKGQVAAKAGELRDAGFSKVGETVDEFNAALPIIREAGYGLASVEVHVTVPPKIVAAFSVLEDVSPDTVEQLIETHADKRLLSLIMKSLHQAWRLQSKIKVVGLKPTHLTVEIGLVPSVAVRFA